MRWNDEVEDAVCVVCGERNTLTSLGLFKGAVGRWVALVGFQRKMSGPPWKKPEARWLCEDCIFERLMAVKVEKP